jgi:hypothetical protein
MFNLSDVGIVYLRGARIERANQAMAALTGYAAPELTRWTAASCTPTRAPASSSRRAMAAAPAPAGALQRRAPAAPPRRQPALGAGGGTPVDPADRGEPA